jgi:hypothetical protein
MERLFSGCYEIKLSQSLCHCCDLCTIVPDNREIFSDVVLGAQLL